MNIEDRIFAALTDNIKVDISAVLIAARCADRKIAELERYAEELKEQRKGIREEHQAKIAKLEAIQAIFDLWFEDRMRSADALHKIDRVLEDE